MFPIVSPRYPKKKKNKRKITSTIARKLMIHFELFSCCVCAMCNVHSNQIHGKMKDDTFEWQCQFKIHFIFNLTELAFFRFQMFFLFLHLGLHPGFPLYNPQRNKERGRGNTKIKLSQTRFNLPSTYTNHFIQCQKLKIIIFSFI